MIGSSAQLARNCPRCFTDSRKSRPGGCPSKRVFQPRVVQGWRQVQTDNAFIESLNGKFRAECLNANWFLSLDEARRKCEAWRRDYNEVRPHSAIGNQVPAMLHRSAGNTRSGSCPLKRVFPVPGGPRLGASPNGAPALLCLDENRGSGHHYYIPRIAEVENIDADGTI